MFVFKDAQVKTAGAYICIDGLYPFAIGRIPHNGNSPVVRLGGHLEGNETGWECAMREVEEEANIRINPIPQKKTYLVSAEMPDMDPLEITWRHPIHFEIDPLFVVAYHSGDNVSLSLMYLAQSNETPVHSAEVKGILLLDPQSMQKICHETITLDQYLKQGGKAIFTEPFERNRILEPFIQLRIFSQLLNKKVLEH